MKRDRMINTEDRLKMIEEGIILSPSYLKYLKKNPETISILRTEGMSEEQSLIESCIKQNRAAQQQLYRLLLPYLRAVATRYLRDNSYFKDALQESFIKIFRSIGKYDSKKAPLKNWAAKIVVNTCLDFNNRVIGEPVEEFQVAVHEQAELPEVLNDLTDETLLKLLKGMPKGYFEVFNLFVIDEYSHQEIADFLGITVSSSRKKLSRAKIWLQRKKGTLTNSSS